MVKMRKERDTLGEVNVPADRYYGAQTQRAVENFPISGLRLQIPFIRAQAVIKLAAARANMDAGVLDKTIGRAIVEAAKEVMEGRFMDEFVVDVFQAGAGTSQNMNMNEVLANRAEEILGGTRGRYQYVHPNDHVNMAQSTNDTIHTAIHIAAVAESHDTLIPAAKHLETALNKKAKAFDHIIKCGRTHLQDAVPIRMGQVFGAYATMARRGREKIASALEDVMELSIGGTAVGTGLNTSPKYRERVVHHISKTVGHEFRSAPDMVEAMQSFGAVVGLSGALRILVSSLKKIADDIRLLGSGPRTGLGELRLPAVQPGSSIMPGKVNPVMAEMINMVCYHANGCDAAVVAASQAGELELNVMMPVIAYNLLEEIYILANSMEAFNDKCIEGIRVDEAVCREYAEKSAALATALSPAIGYHRAAELAKEALEKGVLLRELALEKRLLSKQALDALLDLHRMTGNRESTVRPRRPAAPSKPARSGTRKRKTGIRKKEVKKPPSKNQ